LSFLKRIKEAFRAPAQLFLEPFQRQTGVVPQVSFEDMMEIYEGHPAVASAINFLAWQAVGAGFYTGQNEEYTELKDGKLAKEYIDDWNEQVGLDEMLQITAVYVVGFGNAFWHKVDGDINNVQIIPIQAVERLIPADRKVQAVSPWSRIEALKLTPKYGNKLIPWDEIIHFCYKPIRGDGFGTGLIHKLCKRMPVGDGEVRYSYAEIIGRIEDSIMKQFEKFGAPNELWIFPGVPEKTLKEYHGRIQDLPRSGARFTTNAEKAKVQQIIPERARGFDAYLETLYNVFYLALETPLPKLFTTPGFTEASARAAIEVAERKVQALQRFLKRIVERQVWGEVLRKAGYDPVKAEVRLYWGMPEKPEFNVRDVLEAYDIGLVDRDEARKILLELGWPIEVAPEEEAEAEVE